MGCGPSKRYERRNQEIVSNPNQDPYSNSYSEGMSSIQTEKRQLREVTLEESFSRTQKNFCRNKLLFSDIFCGNCGLKIQ
jgi:hypothetical protein